MEEHASPEVWRSSNLSLEGLWIITQISFPYYPVALTLQGYIPRLQLRWEKAPSYKAAAALSAKPTAGWGGAQLVKCLLFKLENLSLISSNRVKVKCDDAYLYTNTGSGVRQQSPRACWT